LPARRLSIRKIKEVLRLRFGLGIKGGAIIDHETPDKRRFVAVPK